MNTKQINGLIDVAKINLEKSKSLIPVIFFETRKGQTEVVVMVWKNEQEKRMFIELMKLRCETGEVKSYLMLNEAWVVSRKKEDFDTNIRASKELDREECLVATYKDEKGKKMTKMVKFSRKNEQIVFGKTDTTKDFDGLMNFWK
jgi:hypothetical protein